MLFFLILFVSESENLMRMPCWDVSTCARRRQTILLLLQWTEMCDTEQANTILLMWRCCNRTHHSTIDHHPCCMHMIATWELFFINNVQIPIQIMRLKRAKRLRALASLHDASAPWKAHKTPPFDGELRCSLETDLEASWRTGLETKGELASRRKENCMASRRSSPSPLLNRFAPKKRPQRWKTERESELHAAN